MPARSQTRSPSSKAFSALLAQKADAAVKAPKTATRTPVAHAEAAGVARGRMPSKVPIARVHQTSAASVSRWEML